MMGPLLDGAQLLSRKRLQGTLPNEDTYLVG